MRNANLQTLAWFWDLFQRDLLDMDPPYQRRSVWNQPYKDYFIDTVLNGFPSPAIFLFQDISPEGFSTFSVVDGKQRLSTLFEFAQNLFPVAETATISKLRGKYFKDLDDITKTEFWKYQFSVEYLPSSDEKIINTIFDRINRNVAKLTHQELRHARFDGEFITKVEELNEWFLQTLPPNFPMISQKSKKQMKDVEVTAQLVLLIEEGPKSYSQNDLDEAFSIRDESWEEKDEVEIKFREVVLKLQEILSSQEDSVLLKSRFRNQTDFYSLFGAIHELKQKNSLPEVNNITEKLLSFLQAIDNKEKRETIKELEEYYNAARSASNDAGPRRTRIKIIEAILSGTLQVLGT